MSIAKKLPQGNSGIATCSNIDSLGIGNIIPHWWYKEIKAGGNKPDLVAITILSELYFLHRKSNGLEFNEGYRYLEYKFGFSRAQLQDATSRLDRAGLVTRTFRTVVVQGRNFPNELHLKINLPKLFTLKAKYINSSTSADNDNSSSDSGDGDIFHNEVLGNSSFASLEKPQEHISNRKISLRKNRLNESGFLKNSFKGLAQNKPGLASFYPLVQSDIVFLQKKSSREFTLTATNEILLKLTKKHTSHLFPNKAAFLSYMTKVLVHEKRDAVKISNTNFRLNCNRDLEAETKHRFLEEIEYSRDTSMVSQLRRKLAAVLDENTAYQLLKSASFSYSGSSSDSSVDDGESFTIDLASGVKLSQMQQKLLLEQVRAVYGNNISSLNLVTEVSAKSSKKDLRDSGNALPGNSNKTIVTNSNIWSKVRSMLIAHYGDEGRDIDQNWFSKLIPEIDADNRKIALKAPSSFMKDWVQTKYSQLLEKCFQSQNYNLVGVV